MYSRSALVYALSMIGERWPRAADERTHSTPERAGSQWRCMAPRRRCVEARAAPIHITEQALACALAQTSESFFLSSTSLTSVSSPAATHLVMLSRSGAVVGEAHAEPKDCGNSLEMEIVLGRKLLAACPSDHPLRADVCKYLAHLLDQRFKKTGSTALLEEMVTLEREALALQPTGHPDRATSCNNLAVTLWTHYKMTGDSEHLDEIITLHREALALRPAGHPLRANSCNNLAGALQTRYEMTGSSDLLNELIMLYREALALHPAGHPDRSMSCNNLANTLLARYDMTGSSDLLNEIITLLREALALRPAGHPDRMSSCNNLATALQTRYKVTGSSDLLDESIMLDREALALHPTGHPDHASSCHNLADHLLQRFRKTQDVTAIDEALVLARKSAASMSPSSLWRALRILCRIHLESDSPHLSIFTATRYLSQASALYPDNTALFIKAMQTCLSLLWLRHRDWTADIALLLFNVYSNLIDRLSRMTGFAFDTVSQLAALKSARSFGSDACMAALLSGRTSQAVEQIDHAHGVIWAQALHQRDPQLQDLPGSLASELETLLRAVSVPTSKVAPIPSNSATRHLSPEDVRHQQNSRIQTILTEVRAMPGLERFMLGKTYAQLRKTRQGVVCVSVGVRDGQERHGSTESSGSPHSCDATGGLQECSRDDVVSEHAKCLPPLLTTSRQVHGR
jgi:hypothetical protein